MARIARKMQSAMQICRLCLQECASNSSLDCKKSSTGALIAQPKMTILNDNVELLNCIYTMTSLKIVDTLVQFVQFVCPDCLWTLQNYATFRERCIINDTIFRSTFCSTPTVPEYPGYHEPSNAESPKCAAFLNKADIAKPFFIRQEPTTCATTVTYTNQPACDSSISSIVVQEKGTEARSEKDDQASFLRSVELAATMNHHIATAPKYAEREDTVTSLSPEKYRPTNRSVKVALECDICERTFPTIIDLNRHTQTHTGERPFECQVCGKNFLKSSSFFKHLESHKETNVIEQNWECEVCGKRFTHAYVLKEHWRSHIGIRPFECKVCLKKFFREVELKVHSVCHTGDKPYECEVCGKRNATKQHLQLHMRTHTGERPYPCNMCTKRFSQISALKTHIRTHTGEKPFQCGFCGRSFTYSHARNTHLKREHMERIQ